MKKQLFTLITLCVAMSLHAQTIYLSTLNDKLLRLNINSCEYKHVVDIQTNDITDIAFHPNGKLYGIDFEGFLFEIDTTTGFANNIHKFTITQSYNSLTIDDYGIVYAAGSILNENKGHLLSYNLTLGTESSYGEFPFGAAGDLTFYNGDLYIAVQDNKILKIDLNAPLNSETIIDRGKELEIYGIVTYIDDCRIIKTYGISSGNSAVYEIDFSGRNLNLVCQLDVAIGGGASTFEHLGASAAITVEEVETTIPDCSIFNGSIFVDAVADTGTISFSIDGANFQPTGLFEDLTIGNYRVTIDNNIGCPIFRDYTLAYDLSTEIVGIETGNSKCTEESGFITINAQGGKGELQYSIDQVNYYDNRTFLDLGTGEYQIFIKDEANCIIDTLVSVMQGDCDIFIPNAFTPNYDGFNDLFKIYPHSAFLGQILSLKIFDRWGGLMFEANNFDINKVGWDGTYKGENLPPGVYVYVVEAEMENGTRKILKGDVTLLR